MKISLTFLLFLIGIHAFPQYIPVQAHDNDVYSFLDEFRLEYNPAVRPLGRTEITTLLKSIDTSSLNLRQKKELTFYLKDFDKGQNGKRFFRESAFYYYSDSTFSVTVNPIIGSDVEANKNGMAYRWWNGAEAYATIGKWGIYGRLIDNHESDTITYPTYLDQRHGGSSFKPFSSGKVDFEEISGGVTYAWKTGHIGLIKDNFSWGTNYNGSNIFSGRTPAFVHLDLHLKPLSWLDFHYVHGWLNSEVVDSSRSYTYTTSYGTDYRKVYHSKFLAANIFTFTPIQNLRLSAGNSIIYDFERMHPAFLIPVMFFKAVDHSLNSGIKNMNSQMFFDISSKNLNHIHLYSTIFIDELAVKRIFKNDEHNFVSFKGGMKISNLIPNTFGGMEYTITNALTFRHDVPTTTFESNRFNLGHYLTDNSKELYLNAGYKPLRNMIFEITYIQAQKGPDHTELGTEPRQNIKSFTPIVWESKSFVVAFSWQALNNLFLRMDYEFRNVTGNPVYIKRYTPEFWRGKTGTVSFGVNYGF